LTTKKPILKAMMRSYHLETISRTGKTGQRLTKMQHPYFHSYKHPLFEEEQALVLLEISKEFKEKWKKSVPGVRSWLKLRTLEQHERSVCHGKEGRLASNADETILFMAFFQ